MTKGARVLIWLTLSLFVFVGFFLGYGLHLTTAIQRFARETDRTSEEYEFSAVWISPEDGGTGHPAILATPKAAVPSAMTVYTRWHWTVSNPEEPCLPDEHRLIWRAGKDRWELVDDLGRDVSVPPFPEDDDS